MNNNRFRNNNRNNRNNRSNQNNEPRISLKKLEDLLFKPPDVIILHLFDAKFNFDDYLYTQTMGDNLIETIIVLIHKSLECNSLKIKVVQLVKKIAESKFLLDHVYEKLNRRVNGAYNIEFIRSVLNLCCRMLELEPSTFHSITRVKERLGLLIKNRLNNNHDLVNSFDQKFTLLERTAVAKLEQERQRKTFRNIDQDSLEPPNNFAELNIIPKLEDILTDHTPFLRRNITNAAYKDVNHYLDVQFRLLREDYLNPLREGILKFRGIIHENTNLASNQKSNLSKEIKQKLKNIESLNVFLGVSLDSKITASDGVNYGIKLNLEKSINWDDSKKLMFGSLVCLSSDFFMNECLIGVVGQRDLRSLKEGIIFVRFDFDLIGTKEENSSRFNYSYTMIEATSYFESYRHVLEALVAFKNSNHDEFPFKEHLVFCLNNEIEQPEYLKNEYIDFRTLVDHQKEICVDKQSGETSYLFSRNSRYAERIWVSDKHMWPKKAQMKLDESQYEAIRLALENRIALIQGY